MSDNHIAARPLLNGTPIPDFTLLNSQSQPVNLADIRQPNGVVVAFIHATWCPYCLRQLRRLNTLALSLLERQIGIACISADPPDTLYAYEQSTDPPLRYPLLADSNPSLAHIFGIYDPNPEHESPYPAVFFAGANNAIAYTDVSSDFDCFPNMERLIEVIDSGVE